MQGRFIGPKVLINSIPKSGTNLLYELVNLLPLMRGRITRTLTSDNGSKIIVKKMAYFKKGQSVPGHIAYHDAIQNAIIANQIKHLLIIRDFRDVILSNINYLENIDINHPHNKAFKNMTTMEEKIEACITGLPEVGMASWPKYINSYREWLCSKNICVIHFENLINSDKYIVESEIYLILKHLNINQEIDINTIRKKMINPNGLTFNKPSANKWKTHFNSHQIKLLNDAFSEELIYFGYDK